MTRIPNVLNPPNETGNSASQQARLLLISGRNISKPTGEWSLISRRAVAIRNVCEVETDVLYLRRAFWDIVFDAVHWAGQVKTESLKNPIDIIKSVRHVRKWLSKYPRGRVVLSGLEAYPFACIVPFDRLIVDLHGTLEEWLELPDSPRARLLKFAHPLAAALEREVLNRASGAFSVSADMSRYAGSSNVRQVWTVPCGLLEWPSEEQAAGDRAYWRVRLGLQREEVAFAYSGGFSSWQCVEEAAILFNTLRETHLTRIRMVILSPDVEQARLIAQRHHIDDAIIAALLPGEVVPALCGCDIGVMLRQNNRTNQAAFPNKFAEYLSAGLFVISSGGLTDPAAILRISGLGFLVDPAEVRRGMTPDHSKRILRAVAASGTNRERRQRAHKVAASSVDMTIAVQGFARGLESA
jgi:hypothetical protein